MENRFSVKKIDGKYYIKDKLQSGVFLQNSKKIAENRVKILNKRNKELTSKLLTMKRKSKWSW